MRLTAFVLAGAALLIAAAGERAEARIVCDGAYQIVQGSPVATPYCEDNYLAAVARSYGMKVSAAAVRSNPSTKAQVCYTIGHDIRVTDICASYRRDGRRRF